MSADEEVARDVVGTLRDGQKGYESAADRLGNEAPAQVVQNLKAVAAQRAQFANDIVAIGASYGDDVAEDGSVAAAFHRGWMAIKDGLTGANIGAVINVCIEGDEHALEVYDDALAKEGVSPEFAKVLADQRAAIQETLATLKSHT